MGLPGVGLAGTLERAAIDEVKDDAVRELLAVEVGSVGSAEFGEIETLGHALGLLAIVSKSSKCSGGTATYVVGL